jgi:flagellar biosynthesis/type III secretory pathway chaperone|tara:strand:+ start:189 stop:659 length:471 start_codon:yes stop_codon:yes gene_type:complete
LLPQLIEEFDGHLTQAISDAQQLQSTLDLEYDHLKNSDLEAFQELQVRKQHDVQTIQLFDALRNQFCRKASIDQEDKNFSQHLPPSQQTQWQQLLDILEACNKTHRTSDYYMRTKLESISKALETLELSSPMTSTNLYNSLGNAFKSNIGRSLDKA